MHDSQLTLKTTSNTGRSGL